MGGGTYSFTNRTLRAKAENYRGASVDELFTQSKAKKAHNLMDSKEVTLRESRDSASHPNSYPIIFGLDVTGSMHVIPHNILKEQSPYMMEGIFRAGIPDPQVLFMGIGDHYADKYPCQIGQFESNDELMDKWLKTLYLEGGGGRGDAESYHLAWYFAAFLTAHDAFQKRGQKGLLITVGDEPCHPELEEDYVRTFFTGQPATYTKEELLAEAKKTYNVFHIHIKETRSGSRPEVQKFWKDFMGANCIMADSYKELPDIIAKLAHDCYAGPRQKVEIDTPAEFL